LKVGFGDFRKQNRIFDQELDESEIKMIKQGLFSSLKQSNQNKSEYNNQK
jgi:hypothetical protein